MKQYSQYVILYKLIVTGFNGEIEMSEQEIKRYGMNWGVPEEDLRKFASKFIGKRYPRLSLDECANYLHMNSGDTHFLGGISIETQIALAALRSITELEIDEQKGIVSYDPRRKNLEYHDYTEEDIIAKNKDLVELLKTAENLHNFRIYNPEEENNYLTVFSEEEPPKELYKPITTMKVNYTKE